MTGFTSSMTSPLSDSPSPSHTSPGISTSGLQSSTSYILTANSSAFTSEPSSSSMSRGPTTPVGIPRSSDPSDSVKENNRPNHTAMIVGVVVGSVALVTILVVSWFIWKSKMTQRLHLSGIDTVSDDAVPHLAASEQQVEEVGAIVLFS
jgi:hypothetical protein